MMDFPTAVPPTRCAKPLSSSISPALFPPPWDGICFAPSLRTFFADSSESWAFQSWGLGIVFELDPIPSRDDPLGVLEEMAAFSSLSSCKLVLSERSSVSDGGRSFF